MAMDNADMNEPNAKEELPSSMTQQGSSPFLHSSSSDEDGDGESVDTSSIDTTISQNRLDATSLNDSSIRHHRKNKSNDGGSKLCRVCGDKALGYNFNVISCESCKAFFRRNALKKKEFVCPFTNNCDVTFISRRFCQKCRLRKCFEVGMNPDWIMSEEALAAKRRRRLESNPISGEKLLKSTSELRKITTAGAVYPTSGNVEPIFVSTGATDGLTLLASSSCSTAIQQQQIALFAQQNSTGQKLIILPVQQLQQPTALSQTKLDNSGTTLYCTGTQGSANVVLSGTTQTNGANVTFTSSQIQQLSSIKSDDDTINIPKSVLVNLITKCHSEPETASLLGNDTVSKSTSGDCSHTSGAKGNKKKCICVCICGANSTNDPVGIEKCNKLISTEDLSFHNNERYQTCNNLMVNYSNGYTPTNNGHQMVDSISTSTNLDFTSAGTQQGCGLSQRYISQPQQEFLNQDVYQQSMYGDMLDAAIISIFQDGRGFNTAGSSLDNGSNFSIPSMSNTIPSGEYCANGFRQLTMLQRQRLEELLTANEVMKEPLEGATERRTYEGHTIDPKLMDLINMTDIAVRRIIKMNKRIEAFRNLCQGDQIALLKGGCTELMILRGVMTYDPEKNSWLTRVQNTGHEYIKLDVLKGVKGNVYEEHKKYVQSFPASWRTSEPIMLILGAITLFSPNRPNILHVEMIRTEQKFYYELLKSYIASIYDFREAETTYAALTERLETLHRVNEFAASIFLDVNPRDVEPLLLEIFDLKK